jgi:hypothetical protein
MPSRSRNKPPVDLKDPEVRRFLLKNGWSPLSVPNPESGPTFVGPVRVKPFDPPPLSRVRSFRYDFAVDSGTWV